MLIIIELIIIIIITIIKSIKLKKKIINKINIKRGKYLTIIGNCLSCHTINGGKIFAGGYPFKTVFGTINTPNITFDKKYGIGNTKLKEFIKIIKLGISKKSKFLYPIFPFKNYSKLKKKNIKEIYLFLKNLKKEKIKNKNNKLIFPLKYNKTMLL